MLYTAFILGLLGSFHCIGMCGPIAFALPVDKSSKVKMLYQSSLYQFGRIISYSLIGLLFGLIGRGFSLIGFQQYLSIITGISMIIVVLIPTNTLNRYHILKPLHKFVSFVKKKLGYYLIQRINTTFLAIGFFNGFLPCGLVYMALLGAIASGKALDGAVYMFAFGLGTVPMMSLAVLGGNFIKAPLRNKIQKAIPVIVIIIGILFILRGLGLGIPYLSPPNLHLEFPMQMCN